MVAMNRWQDLTDMEVNEGESGVVADGRRELFADRGHEQSHSHCWPSTAPNS